MAAPERPREYSFDVLKFATIAIIVLHHYQQITGAHFRTGINWYHGDFYWGFLVELFFIVSGYFCLGAIGRIRSGKTFREFFAAKYLRFLPMLALCGVAYLVARYGYSVVAGIDERIPFTFWDVCASLTGFERWLSSDLMVNNPMWYVSVLLLCFVVFYAVTAKCQAKNLPLAYAAIIAIGLIMRSACAIYDLSLPFVNASIARGLICFFMGLELAMLIDRYPGLRSAKALGISAVVVVLFVAAYALRPDHIYEASRDPLYYALVFVIYPCLVLVAKNPLVQQLLSSGRLRFLGGAAYNMYVWHAPLIYLYLALSLVFGFDAERQWAMYVFLLACFVFGVISDRYIEAPLAKRIKALMANPA